MSASPASPIIEHPRSTPMNWWSLGRWVTLATFVLSMAVLPVFGEERSTWNDLEKGLRSGEVTHVRVIGAAGGGDAVDPTWTGTSIVRLAWRDSWHARYTEIRQVSSQEELDTHQESVEDGPPVIGRIDTPLKAISPSVALTYEDSRSRTVSTYAGWEVAWPWGLPFLVALLFLVLTLTSGPEPRLATRWAWWWLFLTPAAPIVILTYLLYGCRPQQPDRRRLTGGWAFLLMFMLGSMT